MSPIKSIIYLVITILFARLCSAENLWMTDGSTMVFDDTLKVNEAMTPDDGLGSQPYEGISDPLASFGSVQFPAKKEAYVSVEAEWVLILPISQPDIVNKETNVTLQGMVDGKYFANFLQDPRLWAPASIGNNLIASGPGIETTIGEILEGKINATVELSYLDARQRVQRFTSNSQSISNLPLVEIVNGALSHDPEVAYVNLGAVEETSALVNNASIRNTATLVSVFELPFSGLPLTIDSIKQLTLKNISKHIIRTKKYMDREATLLVTDANDNIIGEGYLSLQ